MRGSRLHRATRTALLVALVAGCRGGRQGGAVAGAANAPPASSTRVTSRLAVDCKAPSKSISPYIYGVGFDISGYSDGSDARLWTMNPSGRRMGGNQASRYNWEHGNAYNSGNDWFFENQTAATSSSSEPIWRTFLEANAAHAALSAIEIPMLGWVAKDTTSKSFSLARHPLQRANDPGREAGDGRRPDGTEIAPDTPTVTSVASTSQFQARWVRQIKEAAAKANSPSPRVYILDNEPALWNSTHRDVHPEPLGYDELWKRTREYATAIRQADPDGLIAGPAAFGWVEYFYSARDAKFGVFARPDRRAHEDLPLVAWYLRQAARHEKQTGTRLIDLLDVHFYPQADGIGMAASGDTDPKTQAVRVRSTRALWDPSYRDESWIGEPVRLLPRLHEWIDTYAPGVGIQIGEWNFGAETDMSGGLAVAEALARFADGGVTSAYYWPYPKVGSPAYFAFRAYRDFDGHGGGFLDRLAPSESSAVATLWASRDEAGKHLVLVVLNTDPSVEEGGRIDVSSCGSVDSVRAFTYRQGQTDFAKLDIAPLAGAVAATFAPYSISIVDVFLR